MNNESLLPPVFEMRIEFIKPDETKIGYRAIISEKMIDDRYQRDAYIDYMMQAAGEALKKELGKNDPPEKTGWLRDHGPYNVPRPGTGPYE